MPYQSSACSLSGQRPAHGPPASLSLPASGLLPVCSKKHCSMKEEDSHRCVSQPIRISPRGDSPGPAVPGQPAGCRQPAGRRDSAWSVASTQDHLPCSQSHQPHLSLRDAGRTQNCTCPPNWVLWHHPSQALVQGRPLSPCGLLGRTLGPGFPGALLSAGSGHQEISADLRGWEKLARGQGSTISSLGGWT